MHYSTNHKPIDDLGIVIRTVGERTFEVCKNLCQEMVRSENIAIIKNIRPFYQAVKNSYQAAIDLGKKWSLIVDADVLLIKDGIAKSTDLANRIEGFFCINGFVLDNFFRKYRYAGCHLYSTRLLNKAMSILNDKSFITDLRSESYIKQMMADRGYSLIHSDVHTGFHDFEQYYKDIWCKGFYHGIKHKAIISDLIENLKKNVIHDQDYIIFLDGVTTSLSIDLKSIINDKRLFEEYALKSKLLSSISEKKQINTIDFLNRYEIFINNKTKNYGTIQYGINANKPDFIASPIARINYSKSKMSPIRFLKYYIRRIIQMLPYNKSIIKS